jgi:hypothetical protein
MRLSCLYKKEREIKPTAARQHNTRILMKFIPLYLLPLIYNICCKEYQQLLIFLTIYRVIQEERSTFLEAIVSVIVRKKFI